MLSTKFNPSRITRCLTGQNLTRTNRIQHATKLVNARCCTSLATENLNTSGIKGFESMPGPKLWPVLGNIDHLRNGPESLHLTHQEQTKKYGKIYKDSILGVKHIVISDPSIAEVLYKNEGKFPVRDLSFVFGVFFEERAKLDFPKVLSEAQDEEWAELRAIFNKHLLQPMKVKNYYYGFSDVANAACHVLKSTRDSNDIIEDVLKSVLGRWAMESIGTFTFGQRVGLLNDPPDSRALQTYDAMTSVFTTAAKISKAKWLKYFYWREYKDFQRKVADLYQSSMYFVENVVDHFKDCEEKGIEADDNIKASFVSYLIRSDNLSPRDCASHAIDLYSAGLDTTSIAAFWVMYHLGLNPEKQEKLFAEIETVLSDQNTVTHSMIQNMPYLRACIKETLRFFPGIAGVARFFKDESIVDGYRIPPKVPLLIHNYVMGRDEEIFQDADSFLPERWVRENEDFEKTNPFASQIFGYGPRSCVGRRVAEAEIQILIALLVKHFKIEYIGESQNGKLTIFLEPEKSTKFAFHDR